LPEIKRFGLLASNPDPGWVKERFIDQKLDDHVFIPALPKDNPHLPIDYVPKLKAIFPESWLKRYLEGDWTAFEGVNYLFEYNKIRQAVDRDIEPSSPCVMGVDVARFGDDETVAVVRAGSKVVAIEAWEKTDTMETTGRIINLYWGYQPESIVIDVVGMGAGVCDRLKEQNFPVKAVNASSPAWNKEKFANLRAELFWGLRERFKQEDIDIPDDAKLKAQLSAIRYKFSSRGQMLIESKEEMKAKGMKSPDRADALALAFMARTTRGAANLGSLAPLFEGKEVPRSAGDMKIVALRPLPEVVGKAAWVCPNCYARTSPVYISATGGTCAKENAIRMRCLVCDAEWVKSETGEWQSVEVMHA
jgi:hypothetical protein